MKIENLSVSYGNVKVFENFSIEINSGEITCILGKSGVGKTTLLKYIGGLLDGQKTAPFENKVSFVFQAPSLIENSSVKNNLLLVKNDLQEVEKGLEKVGLFDKINQKCSKLSLGEKQRVNLLRAFLHGGEVTLLDEPFSALDLSTKQSVASLFCNLYKGGKTAVIVTHDVEEAVSIADRIIVLGKNQVIKEFVPERSSCLRQYGSQPELVKAVAEILFSN